MAKIWLSIETFVHRKDLSTEFVTNKLVQKNEKF